jgi:hypothetical protein
MGVEGTNLWLEFRDRARLLKLIYVRYKGPDQNSTYTRLLGIDHVSFENEYLHVHCV